MDENMITPNNAVPEASQQLEQVVASPQIIVNDKVISEAAATLQEYKSCKALLEERLKEEELWWRMRHWEAIRGDHNCNDPKPTSAWLHNTLANKHADAMDNFPVPLILPREESDEESAEVLGQILPVVMEYNDFEDTYRYNWWEKLKHGTAVYGIFWDSTKENGLGDISVKPVDLLNIYFEPSVQNIQDSKNLFILEAVDTDELDLMYPDHAGKMSGGNIDVAEYYNDDANSVDRTKKSIVVDWYYKVKNETGRTVLHYCKFCNKEVLYASENDPELRDRGFYDHGQYPLVFDSLYPEKNSPVAFGYIAICKEPQLYIDQLSANILETSMMNTKKRYFVSDSTAMNMEEFADWSKPFVRVSGEIGEERVKEIQTRPLSPVYLNVLQMKIEEMKDTASNRDVNSGAAGNLTSGAAISAIMEAGNKVSRDILTASYKAYRDVCELVIELIRQFYDESRAFRIMSPGSSDYEFVSVNNMHIKNQLTGYSSSGEALFRRPVFDIKVQAQKRNPFSTMEANQRAQELYAMGFFSPQRAQESSIALEMMEFEGIEKVREYVNQGQTLANMVQQLQQVIAQLTGVQAPPNVGMPAPPPPQGSGTKTGHTIQGDAVGSAKTVTPYQQKLADKAKPSLDQGNSKVRPK